MCGRTVYAVCVRIVYKQVKINGIKGIRYMYFVVTLQCTVPSVWSTAKRHTHSKGEIFKLMWIFESAQLILFTCFWSFICIF